MLVVGDVHAPRWRREVVDRLVVGGLDPGRRDAVELAIHEALCNALEHGHQGDPTIGIELRLTRPHHDRLEVTVVDSALGGPWSASSRTDPEDRSVVASTGEPGTRGHGLALIRAGCDVLRIDALPDATRVVMTFLVGSPVG